MSVPRPMSPVPDGLPLLRKHGLPRSSYLVGGTVRDELLGKPVTDIDCALETDPGEFARDLARELRGSFVPLDRARGTYRVVVGGTTFDFSRLHAEGIAADLAQRDFTINAMARRLDASPSYVIDPFGGRADLARRSVRMIAEENLGRDPLRVLRAYRFSAALDFDLEDETRAALARAAPLVVGAAAERITDEWRLLMTAQMAARPLRMMEEDGLLYALWPELRESRSLIQDKRHHLDVLGHALSSVAHLEDYLAAPDLPSPLVESIQAYFEARPWRCALLKTALLVHDIGKPRAMALTGAGRITFPAHERIGLEMLYDALPRWRYSRREQELLTNLVRFHRSIVALATAAEAGRLGAATPLRFLARWGEDLHGIYLAAVANHAAARGTASQVSLAEVRKYGQVLLELYHGTVVPRLRQPRLLTGNDLIEEFGLVPGPRIGEMLFRLSRGVLLGEIRTREEALLRVRGWLR